MVKGYRVKGIDTAWSSLLFGQGSGLNTEA